MGGRSWETPPTPPTRIGHYKTRRSEKGTAHNCESPPTHLQHVDFAPRCRLSFMGDGIPSGDKEGRGLMEWNSRLFYSFELYYAPPFLDNSAMKTKLLRKSGHGAIPFAGNLISKYSNEQERDFWERKRICADTHICQISPMHDTMGKSIDVFKHSGILHKRTLTPLELKTIF